MKIAKENYYTEIPNIIFRMGLGAYIIAYYSILKSMADEKGCCFMSNKNMAKIIGCSERYIQKMNAVMSKPFAILDGKPLIKIKKRNDVDGSQMSNLIEIVDISYVKETQNQ